MRQHVLTLRCFAIVTVSILMLPKLYAMEDGVYLLKKGEKGSAIQFPGGYPAQIDRMLRAEEYELDVASVTNWNDRFEVRLKDKLGTQEGPFNYLAIVANGVMMVESGGNHVFKECDETLAKGIAALAFKTPIMRKPEGHELLVRFKTKKGSYKGNERIDLAVEVKNVGLAPVFLRPELDTDRRSSQLSIAQNENPAVPAQDVRARSSRISFGEFPAELKPGATIVVRREDLRQWYRLDKYARYTFIGTYQLTIYDRADDLDPAWKGYLTDEFYVEYHGR